MKVEYSIRQLKKFHVIRYHQTDDGGAGTEQKGTYDSPDMAYEVAYALCKEEHSRLGYPPADERIQYPRHVELSRDQSMDELCRRRIAAEIDKLMDAHVVHMKANDGQDHPAIRGAHQALCWAIDPTMSKQPIKMILGDDHGTTFGESLAGLAVATPPQAPLPPV